MYGRTYPKASFMRRHIAEHLKKSFICQTCLQMLETDAELQEHAKKHDESRRKFLLRLHMQ